MNLSTSTSTRVESHDVLSLWNFSFNSSFLLDYMIKCGMKREDSLEAKIKGLINK